MTGKVAWWRAVLLVFGVAGLALQSVAPACHMHGRFALTAGHEHASHGTSDVPRGAEGRCDCVGDCQPGVALVAETVRRLTPHASFKTGRNPHVGVQPGSVAAQLRLPLAMAPPAI